MYINEVPAAEQLVRLFRSLELYIGQIDWVWMADFLPLRPLVNYIFKLVLVLTILSRFHFIN